MHRAAPAFLLILSLIVPTRALAQSLEKIPPPIEVKAVPSGENAGFDLRPIDGNVYIVPGGSVRIFGTSVPLGPTAEGKHIPIEVKKPGTSPAVKLKASLDGVGAFTTSFGETREVGEYVVAAFTADGKAKAQTKFLVVTPEDMGDILDALRDAFEELQAEAGKALAAAKAAMVAKGLFAGDAKVNGNLSSVSDAIAGFDARLANSATALKGLGAITKQYPGGAKHLEPLVNELTNGVSEAKRLRTGIAQANAELSKNNGVCDRIDAVTEVLGAVSLYFDFTGRLFNKVVQIATDKYLPDRIYNDAVPVGKATARPSSSWARA